MVEMIPSFRLLELHERFTRGENINKTDIVNKFGVDSKTFQRDIDKLRLYYSENLIGEIIYDRHSHSYKLNSQPNKLTKEELFAICKILIESRAFNEKEFHIIVDKLLKSVSVEEFKEIHRAINNEKVNYIEPQHGKSLISEIWLLRQSITEQKVIQIQYMRADGKEKQHEVKPVGILFSEFYFYLLAFPMDRNLAFPTIFRIDRINKTTITNIKFSIPYRELFNESEFKIRTPFMYSGELKTIRFEYKGILEALIDRLPSSIIEEEINGGVIVRVEAFGKGVDMWLMSQGNNVKILE